MTSTPQRSTRDRATTATLVILLALAILAAGAAVGGLLLWLVGPLLTVLIGLVAAVAFLVIRAAVR